MRAYLSTFRMRRKLELQYRGAVLGGIVCQIFFGLILVAIYRAMYAGKPQASDSRGTGKPGRRRSGFLSSRRTG